VPPDQAHPLARNPCRGRTHPAPTLSHRSRTPDACAARPPHAANHSALRSPTVTLTLTSPWFTHGLRVVPVLTDGVVSVFHRRTTDGREHHAPSAAQRSRRAVEPTRLARRRLALDLAIACRQGNPTDFHPTGPDRPSRAFIACGHEAFDPRGGCRARRTGGALNLEAPVPRPL
jgi:hypothetical protein